MEKETSIDNQQIKNAEKLKNMFGHIDYRNPPELCTIRDVISLSSDKWSILIILYLGFFPVLRFNKLKKYVYGISNKVLSERLKALESYGYIERKMYPEVPIRVEYSLTTFGKNYVDKLIEFTEWMQQNNPTILANKDKFQIP